MKTKVKKILAAALAVAIVASCVAIPWALKYASEQEAKESGASRGAEAETAAYRAARGADELREGSVATLSDPLEESEYRCSSCGGAMYSGTVDPTCLAEGFTACYCPACDSLEERDFVAAEGHSYEEKTVAPTCTSYGYTVHTCTRCGDSFRDAIEPNLGHDYVPSTVYPTCEWQGYVLYTCTRCGDSYMENIVEAVGHVFETFSVEEGCESYGCDYRRCSVCGEVEIIEIREPLGHDWERETVAATDTGYGYTVFTCSRCHAREVGELVPIGGETHDWRAAEIVEPTCESEGYTLFRCAEEGCDETYRDDYTAPLGHAYALCGISVTRERFVADIRCSRCQKVCDDVSVTVSGGAKAEVFSGCEADISGFSGECALVVSVEGAKLFSLDLTLEEMEAEGEVDGEGLDEGDEAEALLYISGGRLKVNVEGADSLAVWLVAGDEAVLTFPQGGEVDVGQYGLSGDIEVFVLTEDGETVARATFSAALFEAGAEAGDGDEEKTGSDTDSDENSDKEEGDTYGNGYLIAALVGVCVIAAAAIAWLVVRRVRGKKAPDAKKRDGKDWDEDAPDDGEEIEEIEENDFKEDE